MIFKTIFNKPFVFFQKKKSLKILIINALPLLFAVFYHKYL